MGVEVIKDRLGEDQFVLSNDAFYNDKEMGDKFSDFNILKVIETKGEKYVAKVSSKKNYKIYLIKKVNFDATSEQMNQELERLKNLKHQNVIKYIKWFKENENIYIIKEFIDNGEVSNILDAYKTMGQLIEENTLWNIFMQCMSGLDYLHKNNVVHKNISSNNILMTESKEIKIDDIQYSFNQENSSKDESNDIRDMGNVFKELASLDAEENKYSEEMHDIINSMVNENANLPAEYFLKKIFENYIKKVARVSSINSIFRCMSSFPGFIHAMELYKNNFSEENKPVGYWFMKFYDGLRNNESCQNMAEYCNSFRNLLFKNSQINNDVEIRPGQVLEFLLERLNKETGSLSGEKSFGTQQSKFAVEKVEAFRLFKKDYLKNFNSLISNNFVSYVKTKRLCNNCNKHYYSFNVHPFIEFDIGMAMAMKQFVYTNTEKQKISIPLDCIENLFRAQNNRRKDISKEHKLICEHCKMITDFREFKQFYFLPKCFIVYLNRGKNYTNDLEGNFPMKLDLRDKMELPDSSKIFNLVGIVKRIKNDKEQEHFIAIYFDQKDNAWKIFEKNEVTSITDPFAHKKGLILVLFYSDAIEIGQ